MSFTKTTRQAPHSIYQAAQRPNSAAATGAAPQMTLGVSLVKRMPDGCVSGSNGIKLLSCALMKLATDSSLRMRCTFARALGRTLSHARGGM